MQAHPPAKSDAAAAAAVTAPTPPRPGKAGRPSTLLDVEEVEWITRELERLLAREQSVTGGGGDGDDAVADDGRHHHRRKRAKLSSPVPKKGGFLDDLLGRHAVSICSGGDTTTVDRSAAGVGRRGRRRGGRGSFREVEKV